MKLKEPHGVSFFNNRPFTVKILFIQMKIQYFLLVMVKIASND